MRQQQSTGNTVRPARLDKLVYARTEQQQLQLAGKLRVDTDGEYDLGIGYTALIVRLGVMFVAIVAAVFGLNMTLQAWLT
jgi:hypothetical protein